jgi:hypothetical protein
MLGVAPPAFVRRDKFVGHSAERRLRAGRGRGVGVALPSERVGLVQDLRPEASVLGAGLFERQFGVGSERHFAFATVEPVAVDPVGFAVADGAKIEALRLPIGVASWLLEQAPENRRPEF